MSNAAVGMTKYQLSPGSGFSRPTGQQSPGLSSFFRRSCFRIREKYFLVILFMLVALLCYSGFVLLPDGSPSSRVKALSGDLRSMVGPRPIPGGFSRNFSALNDRHGQLPGNVDPHAVDDKKRFENKVIESNVAKEDIDSPLHFTTAEEKRLKVKDMMRHAWDGYVKYAWGANELKPNSKQPHQGSVFGGAQIGASIIDALDTLYIMDLNERYQKAREFVALTFDIKKVPGDLSVFETNIRFVGGLLSIYALTNDKLYLDKAKEVADTLLPAFETPTGIPYAMVNIRTGHGKNFGWASGGSSILSEFGTLSLEFDYLSAATGEQVYRQKIERITEVLNSLEKPNGLYPNYLNPKTGKWGTRHVSLGALGDSFYEYLLKTWLITNGRRTTEKVMYDKAIEAIERELVKKSEKGGLTYIAEMRGSRLDAKMDHLACFTAGMFALQSQNETTTERQNHYLDLAKEIGKTCHESYAQTATGLGPESFRFTRDFEAKAINDRDKYYILRPEVIEGWFYLWRVTKDPKYRLWAWEAVRSLEKHCRGAAGYSGIRNVYNVPAAQDDVQQSFFLAETLKYLYLIFSDDSVMPLGQWVFNSEAHAFPVRQLKGDGRHVDEAS